MKISEFSRISGVPSKTLRYYDEIGLLKPAHVDPQSGYRIYAAEQLARLNHILQYRQLGFSLALIKTILDGNITQEEIQGMLRQRSRVIQARLEEEEERLRQVEAAREDLAGELVDKKEGRYEVFTKEVAAQLVVSLRDTAGGLTDTGRVLVRLSNKVIKSILKQDVPMTAPGIALYHSFAEDCVDVEFAQPVVAAVETAGRMACRTLPGLELAACVVHKGPLNEVDHAHQVLLEWVEQNGYEIILPVRDVYLKYAPGMRPQEFVTEIQYPITKKSPALP